MYTTRKEGSYSLPHSTLSLTNLLNSFNPVTGEKWTPSLQSEIDPTDTTQEVKKVTITEAGPAQAMEQVNPQHLGTYVHYTCRQTLQASTTTCACCFYTQHITDGKTTLQLIMWHIPVNQMTIWLEPCMPSLLRFHIGDAAHLHFMQETAAEYEYHV